MMVVAGGVSEKPYVKFTVPRSGLVTLKIFDLRGRESATLVNRIMQDGEYSVALGTGMQTEGFYCAKLICNNSQSSRIFHITY